MEIKCILWWELSFPISPSCVIKDCEASRTSQLGQQQSQRWLPFAFYGPCVSRHFVGKQRTHKKQLLAKKKDKKTNKLQKTM